MGPVIHIISLPQRTDRRESIARQAAEHDFAYQIWDGIIVEKQRRCTNISQAFKKIVRHAKEKNWDSVTIGEDDLLFTGLGAWKHYLDNQPHEFDLYLAGVYSGTLVPYEPNHFRITNAYSGNTLITVHNRFYDFFLGIEENDHLDRRLGRFAFEKLYLVPRIFSVKQMGGFSDNHLRKLSYEAYEEKFKYFGLST